jgi:4-amino-4-deoxy-L-arabinose transferase-like glycosyltransferase
VPYLTERSPDTSPILARYGALLLCAVWLLAGVVGHDPWKNEDAVHLGVAFGMAGGDWLVPRVAGDPWLVTPPLYHWTAALCGKLLGWLLPWHDAARLASTLFAAGFLAVLWRIAHRHHGASAGLAAPLLAIGTLGLLVPLHEAQPAIVALAGCAVSLWGLSLWRDEPLRGGALFGVGIGIGFLGSGVDSLAIQLATGVLLLLHPAWRVRGSLLAWLAAATGALLLILPWPWLLRQQSPALFDIWWTAELASLTSRRGFSLGHLELLAWASWPVLPLAVWSLWLERRQLLKAETAMLLAATAVALLMFLSGPSTRPTALFPALVPLAVLAASAAGRLRRGAANALDWFGMMTFTQTRGSNLAGRHCHPERHAGPDREELQQAGSRLHCRGLHSRHPDRHRRQRRLDRGLAAHAPLALARRSPLEPRPDHDLDPADCPPAALDRLRKKLP